MPQKHISAEQVVISNLPEIDRSYLFCQQKQKTLSTTKNTKSVTNKQKHLPDTTISRKPLQLKVGSYATIVVQLLQPPRYLLKRVFFHFMQ